MVPTQSQRRAGLEAIRVVAPPRDPHRELGLQGFDDLLVDFQIERAGSRFCEGILAASRVRDRDDGLEIEVPPRQALRSSRLEERRQVVAVGRTRRRAVEALEGNAPLRLQVRIGVAKRSAHEEARREVHGVQGGLVEVRRAPSIPGRGLEGAARVAQRATDENVVAQSPVGTRGRSEQVVVEVLGAVVAAASVAEDAVEVEPGTEVVVFGGAGEEQRRRSRCECAARAGPVKRAETGKSPRAGRFPGCEIAVHEFVARHLETGSQGTFEAILARNPDSVKTHELVPRQVVEHVREIFLRDDLEVVDDGQEVGGGVEVRVFERTGNRDLVRRRREFRDRAGVGHDVNADRRVASGGGVGDVEKGEVVDYVGEAIRGWGGEYGEGLAGGVVARTRVHPDHRAVHPAIHRGARAADPPTRAIRSDVHGQGRAGFELDAVEAQRGRASRRDAAVYRDEAAHAGRPAQRGPAVHVHGSRERRRKLEPARGHRRRGGVGLRTRNGERACAQLRHRLHGAESRDRSRERTVHGLVELEGGRAVDQADGSLQIGSVSAQGPGDDLGAARVIRRTGQRQGSAALLRELATPRERPAEGLRRGLDDREVAPGADVDRGREVARVADADIAIADRERSCGSVGALQQERSATRLDHVPRAADRAAERRRAGIGELEGPATVDLDVAVSGKRTLAGDQLARLHGRAAGERVVAGEDERALAGLAEFAGAGEDARIGPRIDPVRFRRSGEGHLEDCARPRLHLDVALETPRISAQRPPLDRGASRVAVRVHEGEFGAPALHEAAVARQVDVEFERFAAPDLEAASAGDREFLAADIEVAQQHVDVADVEPGLHVGSNHAEEIRQSAGVEVHGFGDR